MGKADIHIHTIFSDGLMSPEALVEHVVHNTDLDVIAVTDHDTIAGALVAKSYVDFFKDTFRKFEVIVGTEVTSAEGDILGLFVNEDVPKGMSAADTIAAIHEQGGLAIAAHPFSHAPVLLQIDGMLGAGKLIGSLPFDGVEAINGTPSEFFSNRLTAFNNRRWQELAVTGGSDGHYLPSIGGIYTEFHGKTAADLRYAIEQRETRAGGGVYNPFLIFRLIRDLLTRQLPATRIASERRVTWPLA